MLCGSGRSTAAAINGSKTKELNEPPPIITWANENDNENNFVTLCVSVCYCFPVLVGFSAKRPGLIACTTKWLMGVDSNKFSEMMRWSDWITHSHTATATTLKWKRTTSGLLCIQWNIFISNYFVNSFGNRSQCVCIGPYTHTRIIYGGSICRSQWYVNNETQHPDFVASKYTFSNSHGKKICIINSSERVIDQYWTGDDWIHIAHAHTHETTKLIAFYLLN